MRNEAEILRALKHLEEADRGTVAAGSAAYQAGSRLLKDVLRWVLEQPSGFGKMVGMCDQVDREERHKNS
jgi:hypothetical protein